MLNTWQELPMVLKGAWLGCMRRDLQELGQAVFGYCQQPPLAKGEADAYSSTPLAAGMLKHFQAHSYAFF